LGTRTDLVVHHSGGVAGQNNSIDETAWQTVAHPALTLLLLEMDVRHALPRRFMEQIIEENYGLSVICGCGNE
jgi:hypothetical protein